MRRFPGQTRPQVARQRTDPCKLVVADFRLVALADGFVEKTGIEGGHRQAVGRGNVARIQHCAQAAGSGHVAHDDRRHPRHKAGIMAREQARILIIAPARADTHHKADTLAGIEGRCLLRKDSRRRQHGQHPAQGKSEDRL